MIVGHALESSPKEELLKEILKELREIHERLNRIPVGYPREEWDNNEEE